MKIKFARTLAIASALSVAFAGLTAFAAKTPTVETITTYDHATKGDVTVTTTIKGLTGGTEVAYYVCDETTNSDIVYIDQGTFPTTAAEGDDEATLRFTFTDTTTDFLRAMAKFGSNETDGATFPVFYFNEGTNRLNGTEETKVEYEAADWGVKVVVDANDNQTTVAEEVNWNGLIDGNTADMSNAYSFKGKLSGNAKNYGVKIVRTTGVTDYFPAYGCADDGTFVVIIENLTINSEDNVTYFVNVEQSVLESTSSSTQQ